MQNKSQLQRRRGKRRELSLLAILLGVVITVVFGAANAYLGLLVGMTVSASIPAAVISMAALRALRRPDALLENNMVQTVGSAGESLAAGVIFTIPAFILLDLDFSLFQTFLLSVFGGFLGILMMIPLRHFLVVEEHETLPFPEGTACAEVLKAGERGGVRARTVFEGLGIGAVYRFFADEDGLNVFSSSIESKIPGYPGAMVGMHAYAALLGVGYIIGVRIACLIFAGGVLGWLVLIPLITTLGSHIAQPIYPATELISQMGPKEIWSNYIRYIGAGGVAFGGFLSLLRSLPMICRSVRTMLPGRSAGEHGAGVPREEQDINLKIVVGGVVLLIAVMAVLPNLPVGVLGAALIAVFGFFFVAVISRIVGIVGGSSCPVSGMTIATLLVCTAILRAAGYQGKAGMAAAISIGAVVCIAMAIASDTSQDLKTGFLVRATPWRQQVGQMIGVLASCLIIGLVVMMLHKAYVIGSEKLSAPQATIMSLVVKGVMEANLPWNLVFMGMAIALVVELLGVRSLPFSIGLYLKIHLTTPIILGGILHWLLVGRKSKKPTAGIETTRGTLFGSGLIAGDAFLGVMLAGFKYFEVSLAIKWLPTIPQAVTLIPFLIVALLLARTDWRKGKGLEDPTDNTL
ncbi:oligopeptide transporter, OPT family [bacterium]|nr:oligopeptide transporter, OPT family [bacterium]